MGSQKWQAAENSERAYGRCDGRGRDHRRQPHRFRFGRSNNQNLGLQRGKLRQTLTGHTDAVTAVAVTADGRFVVSGSEDRTVAVWDKDTAAELGVFAGHVEGVSAVAVSQDGRWILSGLLIKRSDCGIFVQASRFSGEQTT